LEAKLRFKPRRREQVGKITWRIAHEYTVLGNGKKSAKYLQFSSEEEALAKQKELLRIQAQGDELTREAFKISNSFSVADCAPRLL